MPPPTALRALPVVLLGTVLAVSACAPARGVSIPPGAADLDRCLGRTILVDDLASVGEPGCDLAGSVVWTESGIRVVVQPVGITFSSSLGSNPDFTLTVVNWGVPGVSATLSERGEVVQTWATSETAADLEAEQQRLDGLRP